MEHKNTIFLDLNSFQKIYDANYESLCKFLLFYTKDIQVVEDIVQEIFLSLWENREKIEITHIKTYLFQSAKNRMLNHLRDEQNRSVLLEKWFREQLDSKIPEQDKFDTEQLLAAVEKAVEQLPAKCREIFILSKTQNLTYNQIAELKQISAKTVENQMGIALKKIREYFVIHYPSLLIFIYPIIY